LINTGVLTWNEIRPVVHQYFNFWPDGEDVLWFKQLWPYLEKSRLTVYHTEKEEINCRAIPGCLALFYQEIIERLGIDHSERLKDVHYNEMFEDGLTAVENILNEVRCSLVGKLGSQRFFELTIESIIKGNNAPHTQQALTEVMKDYVSQPLMHISIERVRDFLVAGSLHANDFEAVTVNLDKYILTPVE
jgi:hypothetical protein